MRTRIIGIYKRAQSAVQAIEGLEQAGMDPESIGLLLSDTTEGRALLWETTDVTKGAVAGSALGGVLGVLAATAMAIPGVGILAAGSLALVMGGVAGAASGGILGALVGLGMPEHDAELRSEEVEKGAVLVTVDLDYAEAHDEAHGESHSEAHREASAGSGVDPGVVEEVERIMMTAGATDVLRSRIS